MQALWSNMQTILYATYLGTQEVVDDNGLRTGERNKLYTVPTEYRINISASRGSAEDEPFGIDTKYDRTMLTNDMTCPINEQTILWIGRDGSSPYNYKVVKVARSLNTI